MIWSPLTAESLPPPAEDRPEMMMTSLVSTKRLKLSASCAEGSRF
jgi:hypothetical protein